MNSDEECLSKSDVLKLFEIKGHLVGTAGGSYAGLVFLEWYRGKLADDCMDATIDQGDDFECMVVEPNGNISLYNRYLIPDERGRLEYFAIGCGAKCAMVAMGCGKSAIEAVRWTSKYDLFCGGPIQHKKLKGDKWKL